MSPSEVITALDRDGLVLPTTEHDSTDDDAAKQTHPSTASVPQRAPPPFHENKEDHDEIAEGNNDLVDSQVFDPNNELGSDYFYYTVEDDNDDGYRDEEGLDLKCPP